jgi:hypothetical protein
MKNLCCFWSPKNINGDFEAAVVSAINKVFPDSVITGYDFNFSQWLWRQLKHIGFKMDYKENEHPTRIQNMSCFGIITFQ